MAGVSDRIVRADAALPLRSGLRVLEIGCGPGVAARGGARNVGPKGFVLGIDSSAAAIDQTMRGSAEDLAMGQLGFPTVTVEDFAHLPGLAQVDLAFALRVGALDGRTPATRALALSRIETAPVPGGRLFLDTDDPLAERPLTQA